MPRTLALSSGAALQRGAARAAAGEIAFWGRAAAAALAATRGRIIAVFERSFYVETDTGLACLGAIDAGPLNARCAQLSVEAGGAVVRHGTTLLIGAHEVATGSAIAWRPAKASSALDPARVATLTAPPDGLGAVAVALARGAPLPTSTALLRRAAPAIEALRRHDLDSAAALIGLGPGLTPSGDDLIGGYLVARADPALATWAVALARTRTSRISAAHLEAAAGGEAAAAFHDALNGGPLEPLLALGHSSGWDMLAGAMLALTSGQ
jgi:hypothetical protein